MIVIKVILLAITSISTAIILLLLLHCYAKVLFWRRVEEHFNPNQTQSETNPNTQRRRFNFAQGQDDPPRITGLDTSLLQSIPIVVFKSRDFEDGLECAVCLFELVDGDKARVLPGCNHGYHVDCIDMWFRSHSTCPLCRNVISFVEETVEEISDDGLVLNVEFFLDRMCFFLYLCFGFVWFIGTKLKIIREV